MTQTGNVKQLKTLILYWSATSNTEKVANTIKDTLIHHGITPVFKKVADAANEELYDYDLIFLGAPSYSFQPPEPVQRFIKDKIKQYSERGDIKPCAPAVPGKTAAVFCTYSGPHTGVREAKPAGDYMEQFFEHLGFKVDGKWYVVGEFHGREDFSTKGRLGDIRGRPDKRDLEEIAKKVSALLKTICS